MPHDATWILGQIPDPNDRRIILQLISRYEIVRLHLLRPADPLDADALKERVADLEGKLEEWHAWADKNLPIHHELVRMYDALCKRCAEVEGENKSLTAQVQELLRRCRPVNDVLYQDAL